LTVDRSLRPENRTRSYVSRPGIADAAFITLWAVSAVALAFAGDRFDALQGLVLGAALLVLMALTRRITGQPRVLASPRNARIGAGVVLAVVVLTGFDAFGRPPKLLGWWSFLHGEAALLIARVVPILDLQSLDNSVRYVLLPLIVLFALGWRLRDVGFGPARRGTLRTALLWSAPSGLGYVIAAIAIGDHKLALLFQRFLTDVFRNGYAEEILFRGMLLGVAVRAFGLSTGNVVQALVFGAWHLGADLHDTRGVVWLALADGIATQAIAGYAFGWLTLRTGNVVAAGAAHTFYDGGAIFV
jgi:membrane protease YdiL (CAAX protease family)